MLLMSPPDDWSLFEEMTRFIGIAIGALAMFCSGVGCTRHLTARPSTSSPPLSFTIVSAGQDHTCGLTAAGDVYCWGANADGQLGIGASDKLPHPKPLRVASGIKFKAVSAGYRHSCALAGTGEAYCWGANDSGQLGNGSITLSTMPVAVSGKVIFVSLSAGATHTCGVTKTGNAYCWGGNWHGQLGNGSLDGEQQHECCHTEPIRVIGGLSFLEVTTGGIHTCGVIKNGKPYCWGIANYGRLGLGYSSVLNLPTPTAVSTSSEFLSINPGGFYTCGLANTKIAYCWGASANGELGSGSSVGKQDVPVPVSENVHFSSISAGNNHTCGVTPDGSVYCWGANRFGQIGDGSTENRYIPTTVSSDRKFKLISSGGNDFSGHTCGVTTDGKVMCWGDNHWGQLGNGATDVSLKAALVANPEP